MAGQHKIENNQYSDQLVDIEKFIIPFEKRIGKNFYCFISDVDKKYLINASDQHSNSNLITPPSPKQMEQAEFKPRPNKE